MTINAAFNSGIIDTAVNGAVNYADAQKKEQITFDDLDKNIQDIVNKIESYDIGGNNPTPDTPVPPQDGSWNGEVNSPKVEGTGLIPVYHNGISWVDLTENSTEDEWNKWYDYENKQWANARTKDGSMWVWIPRYEYKIDRTAKIIDVRFIEGTSTTATSGYILHPAFSTDIGMGGWDSNIAGFWVAKYPAGWQNGQGTSLGNVEMSNISYQTSATIETYAGTITNETTKMSYPVFKANTYAYNNISVGDAYTLSQDIKNASRYGLSNVDSHLEKNSEWGAVAYLAHSKYGVNGQDLIQPNKTNKNNNSIRIYAVTSPESVTNTSTTQNITGVYDMSGCILERTATFLTGGTTSYKKGMPTGSNSKYVTLYSGTIGKSVDATNETRGWNVDYSNFVTSSYPVFIRGGSFGDNEFTCGVFAFNGTTGGPDNNSGFRTVLIP